MVNAFQFLFILSQIERTFFFSNAWGIFRSEDILYALSEYLWQHQCRLFQARVCCNWILSSCSVENTISESWLGGGRQSPLKTEPVRREVLGRMSKGLGSSPKSVALPQEPEKVFNPHQPFLPHLQCGVLTSGLPAWHGWCERQMAQSLRRHVVFQRREQSASLRWCQPALVGIGPHLVGISAATRGAWL